jgi:hypothetical protein
MCAYLTTIGLKATTIVNHLGNHLEHYPIITLIDYRSLVGNNLSNHIFGMDFQFCICMNALFYSESLLGLSHRFYFQSFHTMVRYTRCIIGLNGCCYSTLPQSLLIHSSMICTMMLNLPQIIASRKISQGQEPKDFNVKVVRNI